MLTNPLDIPADLIGKVPCQDVATRGLFLTLDLDLDLDDPDYLAMTPSQQQARHAAKQVAERAAVEACGACPLLNECREWALKTQVHGVAGGLTESARASHTRQAVVADGPVDISRGQRNAVPQELVHSWTSEGVSAETIAQRLNCSVRTVERARRRSSALSVHSLAQHEAVSADVKILAARGRKPEPTRAKASLDFTSLTPESLAIYDYLAQQDGPVDRRDVVKHVAAFVAPDTAIKWGQSLPCADEKKAEQGALKFARNRLDIAYRHGRIVKETSGSVTTIALPEDVRRSFTAWRTSAVAATA